MDFKHLSEKMGELQDKIQHIDDTLQSIKVTRESGAGLVKATVNGHNHLLSLEIDEQLLDKEEKGMLQDLIMAAVNLAVNQVEEEKKQRAQDVSLDLIGSLM